MSHPTGPGGRHGPAARAVPDLGAHVIHLGTPEWCWSRLLTTTEGVLSSCGGGRSLRVGVGYLVEDGQVMIPVDPVPGGARLVHGSEVTLAVAGSAEDGLRWVVRATGVAQLSVPVDRPGGRWDIRSAFTAAQQPDGGLLLDVDRLHGYHEASRDAVGWT